MLRGYLALASAPWGALAAAETGSGRPGTSLLAAAEFPVDDVCAGANVADGECSLSFRQLRGELKTLRELVPARPSAAPGASEASCFVLAPEGAEQPFGAEDVAKVRAHFLKNIDVGGTGAVLASPDRATPGGSYYYHWERDGALSMHTLLATSGLTPEVDGLFRHYVEWVKHVQDQPSAHGGLDVRIEPKYDVPSGKVYEGGWCRPQTDGPGLRAKTLGEYALMLLQKADGRAFVMDKLWAGNRSAMRGHPISWDLDWVVRNWRQPGCDLWEEVVSDDFFWGRYTMRAGLHVGAKLASALGDQQAHDLYASTLKDIESTLIGDHWTGSYLEQCRSGVCSARKRERDAAVVEAINVGDLGDGFLPSLSEYVLGTVVTLNELFCSEFKVNRVDAAKGVPGILYGRYPGDVYAGGNPWVLLTASLARLIYRQAAEAAAAAKPPSAEVDALLQKAYGLPPGLSGSALSAALVRAGDGVLLRMKIHLPSTMHMAEQLDRNTGEPLGAEDLTWNYANVLLALHARGGHAAVRGP